MGLFDQIAGALTGQQGDSNNALLGAVMHLVDNPQTGGLSGLVQAFHNEGLGDIVKSWVSTGQNLPISAEQIQGVLGNDQLQSLASRFGLDVNQLSGRLAELLPQAVDQLTPGGTVPDSGKLMEQGMQLLKGRLFG